MPVVDDQNNWKTHEALFRVASAITVHSPRGSAWCSTSRKAETMLGRSFSGRTARGTRRREAGGKCRWSTCPRFLACYTTPNEGCIERYERGEVKRRFSKQPRRVGTLRGDPRTAARCGEWILFDPVMANINKHGFYQNHITIIRSERRSFHKCGAQMGFLQLPAAPPCHGHPPAGGRGYIGMPPPLGAETSSA